MKKNNSSYLEVLSQLRKLIALEYKEGGWLPSVRKMCAEFGVNNNTYTKALRCLEHDGIVKSYHKKGCYVIPEFLHIKKVGVILQAGGDSPFLGTPEVFSSFCDSLHRHNIEVQIIQAADIVNVFDKALIHGVMGVVWLNPLYTLESVIEQLNKKTALPLLIVSAEKWVERLETIPTVSHDLDYVYHCKEEWLKRHNHKNVAYLVPALDNQSGCPYFQKFMENTGVTFYPIQYGQNGKDVDLSILSDNRHITAMMIEGTGFELYRTLGVFSNLRNHNITDVYVDYSSALKDILRRYPNVKITAVSHADTQLFGLEAAKIIVDYFENGKPVKSKRVSAFKIKGK